MFRFVLNDKMRRSAEEIAEHSGICFQCDELMDRVAHRDPVTRATRWNQNLSPACWTKRKPRPLVVSHPSIGAFPNLPAPAIAPLALFAVRMPGLVAWAERYPRSLAAQLLRLPSTPRASRMRNGNAGSIALQYLPGFAPLVVAFQIGKPSQPQRIPTITTPGARDTARNHIRSKTLIRYAAPLIMLGFFGLSVSILLLALHLVPVLAGAIAAGMSWVFVLAGRYGLHHRHSITEPETGPNSVTR